MINKDILKDAKTLRAMFNENESLEEYLTNVLKVKLANGCIDELLKGDTDFYTKRLSTNKDLFEKVLKEYNLRILDEVEGDYHLEFDRDVDFKDSTINNKIKDIFEHNDTILERTLKLISDCLYERRYKYNEREVNIKLNGIFFRDDVLTTYGTKLKHILTEKGYHLELTRDRLTICW